MNLLTTCVQEQMHSLNFGVWMKLAISKYRFKSNNALTKAKVALKYYPIRLGSLSLRGDGKKVFCAVCDCAYPGSV